MAKYFWEYINRKLVAVHYVFDIDSDTEQSLKKCPFQVLINLGKGGP